MVKGSTLINIAKSIKVNEGLQYNSIIMYRNEKGILRGIVSK